MWFLVIPLSNLLEKGELYGAHFTHHRGGVGTTFYLQQGTGGDCILLTSGEGWRPQASGTSSPSPGIPSSADQRLLSLTWLLNSAEGSLYLTVKKNKFLGSLPRQALCIKFTQTLFLVLSTFAIVAFCMVNNPSLYSATDRWTRIQSKRSTRTVRRSHKMAHNWGKKQ